jgi:type II secretory pathway pseudopilin PulG
LPEVLIAMALALLALLLGAGIALQVSSTARRLDAQSRADRALEAALEALRGGQVPLRSGFTAPLSAPSTPADQPPPAVWLEVEASDVPDLYVVTARASYLVADVPRERVIQTKVWRP